MIDLQQFCPVAPGHWVVCLSLRDRGTDGELTSALFGEPITVPQDCARAAMVTAALTADATARRLGLTLHDFSVHGVVGRGSSVSAAADLILQEMPHPYN